VRLQRAHVYRKPTLPGKLAGDAVAGIDDIVGLPLTPVNLEPAMQTRHHFGSSAVVARGMRIVAVLSVLLLGIALSVDLGVAQQPPDPSMKGWRLVKTIVLSETPTQRPNSELQYTDGSTRLSAVDVSTQRQAVTLATCEIDAGQPPFCSANGKNVWTETLGPRGLSGTVSLNRRDYRFFIPRRPITNPVSVQIWQRP
jgi:hypothetical protein